MAITYPITLPSSPAPANIRIYPRSIVGVGVSPFSGAQQVYRHQGQFWQADITMPSMYRAEAAPWIAAMLQLNGRYGTFRLGDASHQTPTGVATGIPLVNGAGQTGQSLVTDGWTAGVTGILKQGDYIEVASRLYMVMVDADSDGSGNATLDIWPRLRVATLDNEAITVNSPRGIFRLASNEMPWLAKPGRIVELSFSAVEAL
ncbi:hypothetical protein [Thiobacillus sp.]|uniref:hypothetical protein n=1 Tax=Thiobacillus sp. TaxID=924 RepID=UPI0018451DAF|nr:hypothetical protein [Thiobacillus sp.]MBC2731384.1 hypothetical protein [Thiobacillus sp.]MBC2740121.1 hypothetical protein [Thiobacillus sp.]MBC2758333.1 hypothetical protein [Thiobacillus sp.]